MSPLLEELTADGPVLVDGAWGTQLQSLGLAAGECPDEWNLSHPERVEQVARAYVEAGSQVILTNTFRANRLALAGSPLADRVETINRRGAEISVRAAQGRARVFASIGPSGKMLLTGEVNEEELMGAFTEQASALAEGGADALVVETMADLAEAKVALAAARKTGLPVVVCMVFDSGKEMDRTMMGVDCEQAARELADSGADVIGANCGQSAAGYLSLAQRMMTAADRPVWLKPNAGLPEMIDGQIVYHDDPSDFAENAGALVRHGISFLGGCCGSSPRFITALAREIRR